MPPKTRWWRYDVDVNDVDLTLVIPCFNESESIPLFMMQATPVLNAIDAKINIIFVDDGSVDETWIAIKEQVKISSVKVVGIRFDRNYGQMCALEAGIRKSDSKFVLTMDADLQHPVRYIKIMWEMRNEYSVIAMRQVKRRDRRAKAWLSRIFYFALKRIAGYEINFNVSDFRLMSKEIVDRIIPNLSQGNVIRFLLPQLGISQHIVDYEVDPRAAGKSKYSFKKMSLLAQKSIVTTSSRLLHASFYLAGLSIFFAIIVFGYVLVALLTRNAVLGWASILGTMLVLFSGTFTILAILGAYIGRIIELHLASTKYFIKEEV